MLVKELCKLAKQASYSLNRLSTEQKNDMLRIIADAIDSGRNKILQANAIDIAELCGKDSAFIDRLTLNDARIDSICEGVRQIVDLKDPVGEIVDSWVTAKGLKIKKVRASLGVIGVIYEARPNVTADVTALCIKAGSSVVLRGGSDALNTNRCIYQLIISALNDNSYNSDAIQFIDSKDRSATLELLKQGEYVDVVIPRGGDTLKKLVLENATMPVIASAGGNCHIYIHESANIENAIKICINAKTQRPTVCNACEHILIDEMILEKVVDKLFSELSNFGVEILADENCRKFFANCKPVCAEDFYAEHLSLKVSVKSVKGISEAIAHINEHNTKHSDAIIAEDSCACEKFANEVDSGCVFINASTRFNDGFEFGFGAEIGISTQKLHARGPLGLKQLTSEKYLIEGNGTVR